MRRDDAIRILREHEAEIRAKGVTRLALFGSTARDQAGRDSDVDLLVDYDGEGRSALDFFGLEEFFSELLGAEAEVAQRDQLKRFLKDAILAEALEIFPQSRHSPLLPERSSRGQTQPPAGARRHQGRGARDRGVHSRRRPMTTISASACFGRR